MNRWREQVSRIRQDITLKSEFLEAREYAENSARARLNRKAGAFSKDDLMEFLEFCNKEIVPPNINTNKLRGKETCTRFQRSFVGQNRKLMVESLDACNHWIDRLWQPREDPTEILERFWRDDQVPGAGVGLPTMILYLKEPLKFSVWLPPLANALSILAKREFPSKRNTQNYLLYNDAVTNELRKPFDLKPQEIDYILYRLSAENNRYKSITSYN